MMPCKHCAIAKAKQRNVNKDTSAKKVEQPNKRWSHDIATIMPLKKNGLTMACTNWHILVDEFTRMKFSAFYHRATGRGAAENIYDKITRGRIYKIQAHCKSADCP